MLLAFDLICLATALLACLHYIVTGFHSRTHRLLPLILGLVVLYDFYIVTEEIYGSQDTFYALKVLLLIQVLLLTLYYILDFMQFRMPVWASLFTFVFMFVADIATLEMPSWGMVAHYIVLAYVIGMGIATVAVATYAMTQHIYTARARKIHRLLYLVIMLPMLALLLVETTSIPEAVILPLSLSISVSVLNYLVCSNQMRDTDIILKEELFSSLDSIMILFDADCSYLDSNQFTKENYPDMVRDTENHRTDYPLHEQVKEWALTLEQDAVVRVHDNFFKINMQPTYFKGKLRGYILTMVDVTNEQTAVDNALRLTKEKSDFLANISHDLRSPLNAIVGGTDIILLRDDIPHASRHMVQRIREAGDRLLELVNSVLEFSKLESGKLEFHDGEYDLENSLRNLSQECLTNLDKRPIEFRLSTTSKMPKRLIGDRMRVTEILQNLLSNGIKFTEEGYIYCDISCQEQGDHTVLVTATVKDSGMGIPADSMKRIFEAYMSYADVYSREGTGLGLNIVYRLCKAMGGEVSVESEEGKGSVFTVTFLQKYAGEEWQEPYYFDRDRQYDNLFTKKEIKPNWVYPEARVLLADDLKVNREIVRELCKPWKFVMDEAENGEEALEMVGLGHYDLIILDQMMPVLTGVEAMDRIHPLTQTPVILMTADTTDHMRDMAEEHGFAGYLTKPLDLERLQHTIEALLPAGKRVLPEDESFMESTVLFGQMYDITLDAYIEELKELYPLLQGYAASDLDLFRIKVHGVKGISRQLGRKHLGDESEIMEMAVKAGHEAFIAAHLENYLEELRVTIEEAEYEKNSR